MFQFFVVVVGVFLSMSRFLVTDHLFFAFMQIVIGHVLQSEKQHIEEYITIFLNQGLLKLYHHYNFFLFILAACNSRLTTFNGSIESPNYPRAYSNNANCSWVIDTMDGNTINISFVAFDLESHSSCRYDYLEVGDI